MFDKERTRLVSLPYLEQVEKLLEQNKEIMGKGTPITIEKHKKEMGRKGKKGGNNKGKGKQGTKGKAAQIGSAKNGWHYRVKSKGDPIPGSSVPPKEK